MLNKFLVFLNIIMAFQVMSQPPKYGHIKEDYDYYMFPIRPYQTNTLAGNMGELRTSHFHAGLDIRTGGAVGLPVYAAADGYVSRISITAAGYGKALYVTHPNGEITVYAHLKKFNDTISNYTLKQQYIEQQLHVKLFPNQNELIVKRGDIIGFSGNSGSSAGPHLHFEIRDKNHTILNPLKYNFEEIKDTTPPKLLKLGLSTTSMTSRIEGEFQRKEFDIKQLSKVRYSIKDTLEVSGEIGFELLAYDQLDDANFKCGISEIEFRIGDHLVYREKIDSMSFSEQRAILTHYNYDNYIQSGDKYNKLYVDNGNTLPFYVTNMRKGKFLFENDCLYEAEIIATDVYGNQSFLNFLIKCSTLPPNDNKRKSINQLTQMNNVYIIKRSDSASIEVKTHENILKIKPTYSYENEYTYLVKLNNKQIESIDLCDSVLYFDVLKEVPPSMEYDFYSENIKTHFNKNSLFDTIYYASNYSLSADSTTEFFKLGNPEIYPLNNYIDVTLSPKKAYNKSNAFIYSEFNNNYNFIGGTWEDNQLVFSTRYFGNYALLTDSIPPIITPISITQNNFKFKIDDNLSGIRDFNVFVNGEWILADYDYKTKLIWAFEESTKFNTNDIVTITVMDNASNEANYTTKIK